MESTVLYLVMPQMNQFKENDSQIKPYSLYLVNTFKDFTMENIIKQD